MRERLPRERGTFAWFWRVPLLVWQLLFFVGPLVFLVLISFWTVDHYRLVPSFVTTNWTTMYGTGYFLETYVRTFFFALLSSAVASVIAFPCSYALAFRFSSAAQRFAIFLLVTPFFTSYLVRIYSWRLVLADNSIVNILLSFVGLGPYKMVDNLFGTVVGYLTLCFPIVVLLQLFSLSRVDRTLIEAAHNLGCGEFRIIWVVVVPLAKAGLTMAATFTFILSFGDYVSPSYLGGNKAPVLSTLMVATYKSGSQWPQASVVALTMMLTLLIVALAAMTFGFKTGPKSR